MTATTDPVLDQAPAIIESLARQNTAPTEIEPGLYLAVDRDGNIHHADLRYELEESKATPNRVTGFQEVHNPESFIAWLAKHGTDTSEVWADITRTTITGIVNASAGAGKPYGWHDYGVRYQIRKTPGWAAWLAKDGQMLKQEDFAEHIEDRLIDIVDPPAATMLELAQSFQAARSGRFEAAKRLSNGQTTLEWRETIDATAGSANRIPIPDTFDIALQAFEGSGVYRVTARLRYRIQQGGLLMGYKLNRPEDILRRGFQDVVDAVTAEVTQPVWDGPAR